MGSRIAETWVPCAGLLAALLAAAGGCGGGDDGGPAAAIGASPGSLSFAAVEGGADPAPQTLSVTNSGSGTLNWSLVPGQAWLTVAPPTGETTTETDPVTVSVSVAGLAAAGSPYSASIIVESADARNSPVAVAVGLTVAPPGGSLPSATVYDPSGPQVGDVVIFFDLAEPGGGASDIIVEYLGGSAGATWATATVVGQTTGLVPGTGYAITWRSGVDEIGRSASDYRIRITPVSGAVTGTAGTTSPFAVDNGASGQTALWAWGNNNFGRLGITGGTPEPAPVLVPGLETAVECAATTWHSAAVLGDGSVRVWGQNAYGQFGDGTTSFDSSLPVIVPGLSNVVDVDCGPVYTIVLLSDGTARSFGGNWYGQLGTGSWTDALTPQPVAGLANVSKIACGEDFAVALLDDGTVWSWGVYYRETSSTLSRNAPAEVAGISGAVDVACGSRHAVVLLFDGTVMTWGEGGAGQLGLGDDLIHNDPVAVPGISDAVAVAGGFNHTLVVHWDGSVSAWGYNVYGCLGDGTEIKRSAPVTVQGISTAAAVSAGWNFSAAVLTDSSVRMWGYNGSGILGTGSTVNDRELVPVQVQGLSDVARLDCGDFHTHAIVASP